MYLRSSLLRTVGLLLAGSLTPWAARAVEPAPAEKSFLPAFPGAEGYGAITRGGRGGRVIAVTNLNDSGPGSLRAAIEAEGPRTIVFRVSGTIDLQSTLRIRQPFVTIAGQTAPGDGITLKRYPLVISADEVIIRYLRVRLGDESGETADAISARYVKKLILDHVSASWSIDETVSIYHCEDVTVQWCIVSESLYLSHHTKGGAHGFGGIWGSNRGSYHHNLIAHHSNRTPRFASGSGFTDFRHNVIYNWGYESVYGGEMQQVGNPRFAFSTINVVGNYFKPGPSTVPGPVSHRIAAPWSRRQAEDYGKWYVADNVVEGNPAVTANNWEGGVQPQGGSEFLPLVKLDRPWPAMPLAPQSAAGAYAAVLNHAGASLPRRDPVDLRVVEDVRRGEATFEGPSYRENHRLVDASRKTGIIDSQTQVGAWPELRSTPAPIDTDADGMPDDWERRYGLDPNDPSDGVQDADRDGYSNFEEYLNDTDPTEFVDYTLSW
jgi:pectate lyase